MNIQEVPLDYLRPNKWNPRKQNDREFKALVKSIQQRGQLLPIRVREVGGGPAKYEIIGGYHTYKAIKSLNYSQIWIVNEGKLSDQQAKLRSLQDNVHGEDMPFEWAAVIHDLQKSGITLSEIAESVGKKQIEVEDALKVLELDKPTKELDELVSGPHLIDIGFILDAKTEEKLDEIVKQLSTVLKRYKATIVSTEKHTNKARQSVFYMSVSVTEPQRQTVEEAIDHICEEQDCTRAEAIVLMAETYLGSLAQAASRKEPNGKGQEAEKEETKA